MTASSDFSDEVRSIGRALYYMTDGHVHGDVVDTLDVLLDASGAVDLRALRGYLDVVDCDINAERDGEDGE